MNHSGLGSRQDLRFYRLTASALGCMGTAIVFVYRPWTPETVVTKLGGYLVCLYGGFILGIWAQKNAHLTMGPSIGQMVVASLSFQGAALVFIPHFLREQQLTSREAFGFANNCRRAVFLGIIMACLFIPLGVVVQWVSAYIMVHIPHLQLEPHEQESVQTLQMAVTWVHRVVLGIVTIFLAPVAEELLFRGILYTAIKRAGFPRLALWGTAILFAAIHQNLLTFIPLLLLAIALTVLYEYADNLLAPICAHAMFNGINFLMLYWMPSLLRQIQ
ncbi:MAG TPA: CPBP family intramembrane glutamic endopeptidase [Verrucomicrobiae bacterium]|nr:CPBP family intramembrane glutamic endopeptidase [Verrucomicrobiae bacterium]